MKHIQKAIKIGTTNNLTSKLADAYATNGDVHRMLGESYTACECYFKSVELYHSLGNESKMRKVRCLAAVAMAQDVINPYIDTVLKSDSQEFGDNLYMEMLLKWSDCREQFWNQENDVDATDFECSVETLNNDCKSEDKNISDDDQLKRLKQMQHFNSSDSSLINKLLQFGNDTRESYSIFKRFRSDAITQMTQPTNYTKI